MKAVFAIAFAALLASGFALISNDRENGVDGFYIPQADGSFEWMDMAEAEEKMEESHDGDLIPNVVSFYLHTRTNPTESQKIYDSGPSVSESNFNKNHPTRFLIHGWTQGRQSLMNVEITKAWLGKGDYNIIIVDWARARSYEYISSVLAVPGAGEQVGEMIKYLRDCHSMSLRTLQVIGHSLGAHVSGYADKALEGNIHTIYGLDPALPLFWYSSPHKRLSSDDAFYVESIQTNSGWLGFKEPIGKGAFYPNGGVKQPGCGVDVRGSCSHGRSVTYFVEALIRDDFGSQACRNYKDALNNKCGKLSSQIRLGNATNACKVAGTLYVPVNSEYPYGILIPPI